MVSQHRLQERTKTTNMVMNWTITSLMFVATDIIRRGCEVTHSMRQNYVIWRPILETKFRNQRVAGIQCFGDTFAALVTPHSDYIPLAKAFSHDDEFSDVTFLVENEPIRAHRVILARRCKFFQIMFTSDVLESTAEPIPLSGMNRKVFFVLLHYIYTDEIDIDVMNVFDVFRAADMFGLPKLQDACVELTRQKLTVRTAADFLQLAHAAGCPEIKDIAMLFVRKNFPAVSKTSGMKDVSADLMLELIQGYDLVRPTRERR